MKTCEHCKGMGNEPGSKIIDCETCHGTGQHVRIKNPLSQFRPPQPAKYVTARQKKCRECKGEGRQLKNQKIKIRYQPHK